MLTQLRRFWAERTKPKDPSVARRRTFRRSRVVNPDDVKASQKDESKPAAEAASEPATTEQPKVEKPKTEERKPEPSKTEEPASTPAVAVATAPETQTKSRMGSPANPKVAIVGAGLTGLLVAHGLKKNGFDVEIFDSEPHLGARPRDWTIVLHWALPVMQALLPEDLVARLPEAICNPHLQFDEWTEKFPVYNGITGDLLFASPMPGSRRISRQRLRAVLADGLDIQWGKTLKGFTDSAGGDGDGNDAPLTLAFEDGSAATADFVLGADGAGSRVRALLFEGEPDKAKITPAGLLFATALVDYGDADKVASVTKLHPVAAACMGTDAVGGCGVLSVANAAGPEDTAKFTTFWVKIWQGAIADVPATSGPAALAYLKASPSSKGLAAPFNDQIEWTPEGSVCYIDEMKYWVPVDFAAQTRAGRVTLAGDAAHPMLIYRGQGFQHAITDADNYVKALVVVRQAAAAAAAATSAAEGENGGDATSSLAAAAVEARKRELAAYDAELVERGAKAVNQSVQEAAMSFDVDKVQKMLMARQGHARSA